MDVGYKNAINSDRNVNKKKKYYAAYPAAFFITYKTPFTPLLPHKCMLNDRCVCSACSGKSMKQRREQRRVLRHLCFCAKLANELLYQK